MRLLSLRNLTVMLCAALVMLWLFRLFYHTAGTVPLSGHGVHVQHGHGGTPAPRRPGPRSSRDPTVRAPGKRADLQADPEEKGAQADDATQKAKKLD